jgi:diacylglycerol kinase family enzyme
MTIILFNPKSRLGNNQKLLNTIETMMRKKNQAVVFKDVNTIFNPIGFLEQFKKDDQFIIVGGDGTLHQLVNRIQIHLVKQEVYMIRAGTGNDFLRSIKSISKLIPIKEALKSLPYVLDNTKKQYFINGVGLGLDGYVGHIVEENRTKKTKLGFFKATLQGLKSFQPIQATLILNGKQAIEINKTWLIAVMHAKYFGGGMKIAPQANRNTQTLEVVVVKKCPKWLLYIIFPTIYFGWHKIFKAYVSFYSGQDIHIKTHQKTYAQLDGEVTPLLTHLHIKR